MAVAVDVVSTSALFTGATSKSWSHAAGTPTCVGISFGEANSTIEVLQATYGGAACTNDVSKNNGVNNCAILSKLSPASGTQTVVVSCVSGRAMYGQAAAISVTGSDTSTAFSNTANTSGANNTSGFNLNVTSTANEYCIDAMSTISTPSNPTSSQTQIYNSAGESFAIRGGGARAAGAATVNFAWTATGAFAWCLVAASFKEGSGVSDDLMAQACL